MRDGADVRSRDLGRRPGRGDAAGERLWQAWAGLLGGPLAWGAAVAGSYALVPVACDAGTMLPLHLLRVGAVAAAAGAALLSYRLGRRLGQRPDPLPLRRTAFLATAGMLVSAMAALLIAVEWIANFVVPPCR